MLLPDASRAFKAEALGTGVKFRRRIGRTAATDVAGDQIRPNRRSASSMASFRPVVVVDGREEKLYDRIWTGGVFFSPDSRRVAYGAQAGDKWFVVIDGVDGRQFGGLLRGGKIVFSSPDTLYYLAARGSELYLVQEKID